MTFEITGKHVLFGLIGFFFVIAAVNAVFITFAVQTFRGEENYHSYVRGLEYNEVLAERRAQAELDWSAAVNLTEDQVLLKVERADGGPVTDLALIGELRHPSDAALDKSLAFFERESGLYVAPVRALSDGRWKLHVEASGETPFVVEQDLWRR